MEIQEISAGVYMHTSYLNIPEYGFYPSNGLVVIHEGEAYIIDTPWSDADTPILTSWIEDSGYLLKGSLSTHYHEDRSSGIGHLNALSVATYAHALTNHFLESENSEAAAFAFNGSDFSMLDGVIEAYYPGAGHTEDNIVIWLPKSELLFGGCLIRGLGSQGLGNTADASVQAWAGSVQNVIDKYPNVKVVIPGHGKLGNSELLLHTKKIAMRAIAE